MSDKIVQQPVAGEVQSKFSDLPTADVDRSTFDMSHSWKGTIDTWRITPTFLQEVLPGDTFSVNTTAFMRLATPLKPIMDTLTADIHYFFVPNRLVWDNWQFFMGERKKLDDDPTTVSIPQANVDFNIRNSTGRLADAFGLPLWDPGDDTPIIRPVNALPFRGYSLIFNDWYRNQNIIDFQDFPLDDGPDTIDPPPPEGLLDMGNTKGRHKHGDYFTRALPWPQKGDPVFLPLGSEAPIIPGARNGDQAFFMTETADGEAVGLRSGATTGSAGYITETGRTLATNVPFDLNMTADLTVATAATINDIRTAFQIQKLLERDARGGTRYIEIILSHFNVQSPDMRLQRPEYLGGGSSRIIVNPLAQTVATETAPLANLAAVGTGLVKGGFKHSFTEHGYVFGLISCRADLTYQRGLAREWTRQTRYDYYWPALAHLGEQAIKNKELFTDFGDGNGPDDQTWGYQERYAEYRYHPSRITGKFRSEDPESLDVWHLSQDFETLPPLNYLFVTDLPPLDRVVAVPSEPDLIVDVWHDFKATRPMPVYAVPGLVDHF